MESLSPSATFIISTKVSLKPRKTQFQTPTTNLRFPISPTHKNPFTFYSVSHSSCSCFSVKTCAASTSTTATPSTSLPISSTSSDNRHWIVLMEAPPQGVHSKQEVIEYYVKTLQSVLGNEKDAQMCIYDASWDTHFGFCCDIEEETSHKLACLPGVLSVKPDPDYSSAKKDYSPPNVQSGFMSYPQSGNTFLFPLSNTKRWLVRMDKPSIGVVTKAQMVDYYAQILTKVLGK
ncbi:hypothetical protein ACE6H2_006818 [Prunus campanulata]